MVWETFTEKIPYDGWAPLKIASDVAYQLRRPELPSTIIPKVSAIVVDAWGENADKRPEFDELVSRIEDVIVEVQAGTYDSDSDYEVMVKTGKSPTVPHKMDKGGGVGLVKMDGATLPTANTTANNNNPRRHKSKTKNINIVAPPPPVEEMPNIISNSNPVGSIQDIYDDAEPLKKTSK